MSSWTMSSHLRGAALAAALGLVATAAVAAPAHADAWIQFGIVAPNPPVVVAPPPRRVPVYRYRQSYPYAYAYGYRYYAVPTHAYRGRYDIHERDAWRHHDRRDRRDRDDD